jgi:hypothetical protein
MLHALTLQHLNSMFVVLTPSHPPPALTPHDHFDMLTSRTLTSHMPLLSLRWFARIDRTAKLFLQSEKKVQVWGMARRCSFSGGIRAGGQSSAETDHEVGCLRKRRQ